MKEWKAHLAVLAANLIYGANYSIAKIVMPAYIKPFGFIVIRSFSGALVFWVASLLFPSEKLKKEHFLKFLLCAFFGVAVNQMLFFKGLSLTSPINAGLVMITNPIFVLLFAFIFLKEIVTWQKLLGIGLGVAGCTMLILYGGRHASAVSDPVGDLCILINSLSYAVYLVMVKPLMAIYRPITIMKWVFLLGSFMILPFGYAEFKMIEWQAFSDTIWMATAFVVLGSTVLAYLFNTMGLVRLSASTVSVYIYLQPLLAAMFAMMAGQDRPQAIHFASAAFIFSGVYLCARK